MTTILNALEAVGLGTLAVIVTAGVFAVLWAVWPWKDNA